MLLCSPPVPKSQSSHNKAIFISHNHFHKIKAAQAKKEKKIQVTRRFINLNPCMRVQKTRARCDATSCNCEIWIAVGFVSAQTAHNSPAPSGKHVKMRRTRWYWNGKWKGVFMLMKYNRKSFFCLLFVVRGAVGALFCILHFVALVLLWRVLSHFLSLLLSVRMNKCIRNRFGVGVCALFSTWTSWACNHLFHRQPEIYI